MYLKSIFVGNMLFFCLLNQKLKEKTHTLIYPRCLLDTQCTTLGNLLIAWKGDVSFGLALQRLVVDYVFILHIQ